MGNVLCTRHRRSIIEASLMEQTMQLTFLQADKPLTKKYTRRNDGGYESESYPMLFKVTSHTEEVSSLDEFYAALGKHANLGHCLHTGSLSKQLVEESRRGHHDRDEMRQWIVLDLDGLDGFNGVEELIQELPPEFRDTSYIVQHSPSSGIKPGLRAHVFFMLDRPELMKDIKTWTVYTNLATEKLRDEITLTAKDFALSYPLDKIANDNGRVVYITPPECVGFSDPITSRIELVKKDRDTLRFSFASSVRSDVKKLEREHIDFLRDAKGLKKSRVADYYETRGDIDVLKRSLTEAGRVHPIRQDSELIMRCNLDDGDSEAYFYYIDRPQLLRNHKGEPALYMEAIDPEYYNKVAIPAAKKQWESKQQAFVFRNMSDDKYYCGARIGDEITIQPHPIGSEPKIFAWFIQNGGLSAPSLDQIESWEMRFDPTLDGQWNPNDKIFNSWRKTEIMKNAMFRSRPPEIIEKILRHVTGGGEEEYERFINWLAYVYQHRTKTGTAWIFHGVQGTGKGLLVDYILTPIFGRDYVVKQQSRNLRAEFNGWMEKAVIVNLDEFDLFDVGAEKENVMQALKMWITDRVLPVRAMYKESVQMRNFSNFIITTNSPNAIPIPEGERRFNFGVRQNEKLIITPEEVAGIEDELHHFAGYLSGISVDKQMAHTALDNDAKRQAMELSRNSVELFADAVSDGELSYFLSLANEPSADMVHLGKLKQMLPKWVSDAKEGIASLVTAEELFIAYVIAVGDKGKTTAKFKQAMRHKNQPPSKLRAPDGSRPEGWRIQWNLTDEEKVTLKTHLKSVNTNELQAPNIKSNME